MPLQLAPAELLLQIFRHLQNSDTLICATICKAWCSPALQVYYQDAVLSGKNKDKWISLSINDKQQQHQAYSNIGTFVKNLTISGFDIPTIRIDKQEFLDILSFIPFVKKIDIKKPSNSDSGDEIYRYLIERERSTAGYWLECEKFLEHLADEEKRNGCGGGRHIEDINYSAGGSSAEMNTYYGCQYSFRKSLKVLRIRNPGDIYHWSWAELKQVSALSALREFESLTHIYLVNELRGYKISSNSFDGSEGSNIFITTLQSCPSLISLYLNDRNTNRQPPAVSEIDAGGGRIISESRKLRHLKQVDLKVPNLTPTYIKYILGYFPFNLKRCDLHITSTHLAEWVQLIDIDLLTRFGSYLGKHVDNLKICLSKGHAPSEEMLFQSMDRTGRLSQAVLSRYKLFADLLLNNGTRDIDLYVSRVGSLNVGEPDLVIQKTPNKFIIWYDTGGYASVFEKLEELYAMFYNDKRTRVANVTMFWVEYYSISIGHCIFMLQNILKSHPPPAYVNRIIFSRPKTKGYAYSTVDTNKAEDETRIEFGFDDTCSPPTNESLKSITIENVSRLEEASLRYIAEEHNNIKILKFLNCTFDYNNNYNMDLTKFTHLHQLVLDLAFLNDYNGNSRSNCSIKVECGMGRANCFDIYSANPDMSIPPKVICSTEAPFPAYEAIPKGANIHILKFVILCSKIDELVLYYKKDFIATFNLH